MPPLRECQYRGIKTCGFLKNLAINVEVMCEIGKGSLWKTSSFITPLLIKFHFSLKIWFRLNHECKTHAQLNRGTEDFDRC